MDTVEIPTINNWFVTVPQSDWYRAPEVRGNPVIAGSAKGGRHDGKHMLTSRIKSVTGRFVTTQSGSVYRLGDPGPFAVAWFKEIGVALNPDNPLASVVGVGEGKYIRPE